MKKHYDSLRGYGKDIFERDNYICQYCGLDGKIFENWLMLSIDHLLPTNDIERNDKKWCVTACKFCNTAKNKNKYIKTTPQDMINQKRKEIMKTRNEYYEFWIENVALKTK